MKKGSTESHAEKQSGWQAKTFGEVLEIRNGRNQGEVESVDGEFPIYGSAGNVMGMATDFICEAGTTIIGRKGNINSPIYSETRFWNVDTAFGLSAKVGLDSKFLYFFCLSYDFSDHNRGTTIPSLVKSELLQIPIPIPPLAEQQRIVGLLDEAFEGLATAKANAEKNLQNARALFESHLQSVFTQKGPGWVEKPLGEVADLLDCLHKTPTYAETGFPMVRVTDIKPGLLDLSKTRKVDEQTFIAFSKGRNPRAGDIVFSRVGSCGVSALVGSDEPFCLGQNTVFILPKMNSMLLYHFLNSPNAKEQFEGFIDGTTQPTISMKSIRQVAVPIAPPAEHTCLVASLDSMREETQRLARIYERKLAALAELKKSLLHQAFTGEL